jgi:hypothetical protein
MARFYPAVSKNAVPETRRSFKISQSARRQQAAKVRLKTAHENDVKMTPPVDPAASSQASAEKCLLVMRQGLDFDGELLDRCFEFGFDLPAFFEGRGVAEFGTQFVDVLMGRHLFVSLTFVKDDRRGCEGRRRVKVCVSDRRSRRAEVPILRSASAGKIGGARDLEAAFPLTAQWRF